MSQIYSLLGFFHGQNLYLVFKLHEQKRIENIIYSVFSNSVLNL